MIFINEKTIFVKGNIYTNMTFDIGLLSKEGVEVHAKRNVFLGIKERPDKMRPEDFYLDYGEFVGLYGPIRDIVAYSGLAK